MANAAVWFAFWGTMVAFAPESTCRAAVRGAARRQGRVKAYARIDQSSIKLVSKDAASSKAAFSFGLIANREGRKER